LFRFENKRRRVTWADYVCDDIEHVSFLILVKQYPIYWLVDKFVLLAGKDVEDLRTDMHLVR